MNNTKVDRFFLGTVIVLLSVGVLMFISASLGVLSKDLGKFYSILFNQLGLGLTLGLILMWVCSRLDYKIWRKYAFYIFAGSLVLTALVFIPGLGLKHGGSVRWLDLGRISFQPVEVLKIGFIIFAAGWLAHARERVRDLHRGLIPVVIMIGLTAVLLFNQPDLKSFSLITITGGSLLFISGLPWKQVLAVIMLGLIAFGVLVYFKPYARERVTTFLNPANDPQDSSWQINQSLIAIGSGSVFGRGLGQGIQKFTYLPEPQGDSIFAVIAEELGFVGSITIILLYVVFVLRGLRIASRAPDQFGRLLSSGIVIMITVQAFLNIAALAGLVPLTGVPLPFMSHGGTSLLFSLAAVGIVLNVSRYQTKKIQT
ncbi:cell division protein FtsW [Candidatus Nomurabacteria bacterium RIFCSPLOWO2_02_FULL_42_17]|uniref:Probable peptidoglycan glycosyltransferase FtsW n=2 Tax=Parcubacteria group TaxID=1794811 RepID=A0A1F6XUI2_9BACT|nr:MAG: Stage V sporulation protein E [Parcubacteria group bacterium GW2011_GWA2_42_18]OGI97800.1 MAG: cell division protein FtsW [Candidatus Nomurabacteria bacterium RIFCSPLOWO2_02_FULL_42_17]